MKQSTAMREHLKRAVDIIGSAIALAFILPIVAICAVLIKLDGGPAFFIQDRVGKNGRIFRMFKLRTMVIDADKLESKLRIRHAGISKYGVPRKHSDHRITKFGSILRLLNFDELPQFFNVLKGDMSLVGPRPVPYYESLLYGGNRDFVFSIKPGITGLWQIKRRLSTDYDERIALDTYYVKHHSLFFDIYIILLTPVSMITSDYNSVSKPLPPPVEGILVSEHATAVPKVVEDCEELRMSDQAA